MTEYGLLGNLCLEPAAVQAATRAFDNAWRVLSPRFTDESSEEAKTALASAILGASNNDMMDTSALVQAGLKATSNHLRVAIP